MVALPGLRFLPALMMTQAVDRALVVAPGGAAVGIAGLVRDPPLLGLSEPARSHARRTLTSLWNQFANLAFPILACSRSPSRARTSRCSQTAAFVGAAILGRRRRAARCSSFYDGLAGHR